MPTATKLTCLCNAQGLLTALDEVSPVVPSRSPKLILQNVLLRVDPEAGTTLSATDLELAATVRVLGLKADAAFSLVLPPDRLRPILDGAISAGKGGASAAEVAIECDPEAATVVVRHLRAEFTLPTEDPDLFPAIPEFAAESYAVVAAGDLKTAIRRTVFATDVESTRYALGGVMFEFGEDTGHAVGTDGRRLALQPFPVEYQGEPANTGGAVVPVKALKLLDRVVKESDPPVHLALTVDGNGKAQALLVRTERGTVYTRLVEGRFPRYQDVFPAGAAVGTASLPASKFLWGTTQASITTSDESRGVDCAFGDGMLRFSATAAERGKSNVDVEISYRGEPVTVSMDLRYMNDALKALPGDGVVEVKLVDEKNAVLLQFGDYRYVVMPLTRDR